MKKIISFISLAAFCIGIAGCSKPESAATEVEIWSCYSTLKVLQDKPNEYDNVKQSAVINLEVAKGEKEAAQLIMTSKGDAVEYNVEVSDLRNGENVLPRERIAVYHEKYLWVVGSEFYTDEGYYPDCLVPFDNIRQAKENIISENSNQGLYVRFDIPEDQPSGNYTGNIAIKAGENQFVVPVTIKVSGAFITSETHSLSIFNNAWYTSRGELDTTLDMIDKYNDVLLDYRCGTQTLMTNSYETDEEIQLYAEKACEYVQKEGSVCFGIPKFIS